VIQSINLVQVNPIPQVSITGNAPSYCKYDNPSYFNRFTTGAANSLLRKNGPYGKHFLIRGLQLWVITQFTYNYTDTLNRMQ